MESRQAWSQLGRTIQDSRSHQTRSIPPRDFNRRSSTESLELQTSPPLPSLVKTNTLTSKCTTKATFTRSPKKKKPSKCASKATFTRNLRTTNGLIPTKGYVGSPKEKGSSQKKTNKPPPRGIDLRSTRSLKRCRHEHAPASRTSVSVLASHVRYVLIRHIFTGVDRVAI